jgi:hypothetical protein
MKIIHYYSAAPDEKKFAIRLHARRILYFSPTAPSAAAKVIYTCIGRSHRLHCMRARERETHAETSSNRKVAAICQEGEN